MRSGLGAGNVNLVINDHFSAKIEKFAIQAK
jgi:hypothetical protein